MPTTDRVFTWVQGSDSGGQACVTSAEPSPTPLKTFLVYLFIFEVLGIKPKGMYALHVFSYICLPCLSGSSRLTVLGFFLSLLSSQF